MTIGEMAERTNTSADTLRYYERIGLIPPVPRKASGVRDYSEYYVQYVAFIQTLKGMGMSLECIIDYMRLAKEGDATDKERRNILQKTREILLKKIDDLQSMANQAEFQLSNYDDILLPRTDMLVNRCCCAAV